MGERDFPDEIPRIREPVRTHLDVTALVFELERAGRSPVVVYEAVEGHTMPVVTNIAGDRKLLAACLGLAPAELPTAFRERCQRYHSMRSGVRSS
jgi:2,5-furandicarboxylate decarboxylase 1